MGHDFGETQHTNAYSDTPYRQCQRCGRVMFENDDSYFNLACQSKIEEREELREKLESKTK